MAHVSFLLNNGQLNGYLIPESKSIELSYFGIVCKSLVDQPKGSLRAENKHLKFWDTSSFLPNNGQLNGYLISEHRVTIFSRFLQMVKGKISA